MRYYVQTGCGQRKQGGLASGADLNALVDNETIKVVNGKLTAVLPDTGMVNGAELRLLNASGTRVVANIVEIK